MCSLQHYWLWFSDSKICKHSNEIVYVMTYFRLLITNKGPERTIQVNVNRLYKLNLAAL